MFQLSAEGEGKVGPVADIYTGDLNLGLCLNRFYLELIGTSSSELLHSNDERKDWFQEQESDSYYNGNIQNGAPEPVRNTTFFLLISVMFIGSVSADAECECRYYVSDVKMCDALKNVFFEDLVQPSDNMLICLKNYWESDKLTQMQKNNKLRYRKVIEDSYFYVKGVNPEARSEEQKVFLDGVEERNSQLKGAEMVDLFSTKIDFTADKAVTEEPAPKKAKVQEVKAGSLFERVKQLMEKDKKS